MSKLSAKQIQFILNGNCTASNAHLYNIKPVLVDYVDDGKSFNYKVVSHISSEPYSPRITLTSLQVAMIKFLLLRFSIRNLAGLSGIGRGTLQKISNDGYGNDLPYLPCTIKQFLDDYKGT